jgi:hypothetical protein
LNLKELMAKNGYTTDKDTTHTYLEIYDKVLARFQHKPVKLLEIGNNGGESIKLWDDYFDDVEITGIEINNIPQLVELNKRPNINIHLEVDAYVDSTLDAFKKSGVKYDIIIDDGSHIPHHQCYALTRWIDLLTDDGVMVVEDIQDIQYVNDICSRMSQDLLMNNTKVYDRRSLKGRFDDILIVVDKENK